MTVRTSWVAGFVLFLPAIAGGQSACVPVSASSVRWTPPLDRVVRVEHGLPVRDALDAASRQTGVSFTYSIDLLPSSRVVCGTEHAVRLGDALESWLGASALQPVVAAKDRVVLVPGRSRSSTSAPPSTDLAAAAVLSPVMVEEARTAPLVGSRSVSRTVIESERIQASGATSLAQVLSVNVPGMWIWTPSPTSLGSAVASLRGASSFGASYPKVYIDGIEVANPLFLAQLSPDQIGRIEVIRGPQGAALYGAGAVSGVIRITTRQAAGIGEPSHLAVRTAAGVSESAYSPLGTFVQEHAFSGRAGREDRSVSLGAMTSTTGAFVPGAYSRQLQGTLGAALIGSRARWQFTARGASQEAGNPMSPLLSNAIARATLASPDPPGPSTTPLQRVIADPSWDSTRAQTVREYTLASTLALEGARWSHEFVTGVDGYRLDNVAIAPGRFRTPGDSALLAAAGSADRLSLRWTGSRHFTGRRASALLAFGVDQSSLHDETRGASFAPASADADPIWRHTTGVTTHTEMTLGGAVVLNAGVRFERNSGYTVLSGAAVLPTVGAAWRRNMGATALTLRGAYGRAIQPPRVGTRDNPWGGRSPSILSLEPEQQEGIEVGADLRVGAGAMLSLTHFNQRASNLIQPVVAPSLNGRSMTVRLENVGAIANHGWELEGRITRGALNLTGAAGVTDSRVQQLAAGYRGDLRVNDRLLQVPASTVSLAANWLGRGWTSTMTLARAGNWINYDWMGLSSAPRPPQGDELRSYWLRYPGITRVGASFSREITRAFELIALGENLLGHQRMEPDNVTIVPGRTFRAGLRAKF